jgi:hypothetical protein
MGAERLRIALTKFGVCARPMCGDSGFMIGGQSTPRPVVRIFRLHRGECGILEVALPDIGARKRV